MDEFYIEQKKIDDFEILRKKINKQEQKRVNECIKNPKINNSLFIIYLEKLKFEETESIYDYIKRQNILEQNEFKKIFKFLEISQLVNKRQKTI